MGKLADIVAAGWACVGTGDFDTLVKDYHDDMAFIFPGQENRLETRDAFRKALDGIGALLPPGFKINNARHLEGDNEVVSVIEFTSNKLEKGSQFTVLFKFRDDKIFEERWFVDTEQWKAAF